MDLIGRKVPEGNGRMMRRFLKLVQDDVKSAAADARTVELANALGESVRTLQETVMHIAVYLGWPVARHLDDLLVAVAERVGVSSG